MHNNSLSLKTSLLAMTNIIWRHCGMCVICHHDN